LGVPQTIQTETSGCLGQALRANLLFILHKRISASILNAEKMQGIKQFIEQFDVAA
jgi:hypothetical protein